MAAAAAQPEEPSRVQLSLLPDDLPAQPVALDPPEPPRPKPRSRKPKASPEEVAAALEQMRRAKAEKEDRSALTDEQLTYLSERGISSEVAGQIYRRDGTDLLIPYYSPRGDAYTIRSKEPKHDGKPYVVRRPFPKQSPKFLTPAAGGNRPYFSRLMPEGAIERMDWPVVFVEGPIKCDALWAQIPEGFLFVALSGTWNWKDKRGSDGIWRRDNDDTHVLPELREIPMAGRIVTALFDSDISDNNNVYRAAKMLCAWAQQRGARPHAVTLPSEPDGSKNGPDDFLVRHGAEAMVQLLENAEPTGWPLSGPMLTPEGELRSDYTPSEQKRLIKELGQIADITIRDTTIRSLASRLRWKFSEIIAAIEDANEGDSMEDNFFIGEEEFEDSGNIDSRWIVPGFLPRGEVIVLTADPGLGKSLLVYELLYAVATGGQFLGFPVKKGRVLILQLEEGKSSWTTRLKAKGFTALGAPGPGQPWALNTTFDLAKPRHVEILRAAIKQVDVVMVDSARAVGRSFDTDENHADFGKRVIRPLARMFNGTDASGIIIHHNAKGSGKAAGTADITAAVWGVFNLQRAPGAQRGEEGAPNEFHLISDKGRDTDAIKWHLRRERTDGADESGNGWQYELLAELQYMAPDLTLRERVFVVLKGAAGPVSLREIARELAMPDDPDGKVNTSLRSAAARDPGIRRWRIEEKGARGEALYQLPEGFSGVGSEKPPVSGTDRHPPVKSCGSATRQCSSSITGLHQLAKRTESNQGLQKEPKTEGGVCVPPEKGVKKGRVEPKVRAVREATFVPRVDPPPQQLEPLDPSELPAWLTFVTAADQLPAAADLALTLGIDFETFNTRTDAYKACASLFPWLGGRPRIVSLHDGAHCWVIDIPAVGDPAVELLRTLARNPEQTLVGHNLQFECMVLLSLEIRPICQLRCTKLAAQLLRAGRTMHKEWKDCSLAGTALRHLGREIDKGEQTSDWGAEYLSARQLIYNGNDSALALELLPVLEAELAQEGMAHLLVDECRAIPAFAEMSITGFDFDLEGAKVLQEQMQAQYTELRSSVEARLGVTNYRSNSGKKPQMLTALRKLDPALPDTRSDTLAELATKHQVVVDLIKLRQLENRLNTFLAGLIHMAELTGGKVYPNINQIGAASGRTSCPAHYKEKVLTGEVKLKKDGTPCKIQPSITLNLNSSLQGTPNDDETDDGTIGDLGAFRPLFRAPEGRLLVDGDWANIQFRLAANIYNDSAMAKIASNPRADVHAVMVKQAKGEYVPESLEVGKNEVGPQDRREAKPCTFAQLFGCYPKRLQQALTAVRGRPAPREDANRMYRAFHDTFRDLDREMVKFETTDRDGNPIPGRTPIYEQRNLANRKLMTKWGSAFFRTDGINYPVQSCDKEMLIQTLGRLWHEFDATPEIRFAHEAHDEIALIAPADLANHAAASLKAAMESDSMRKQFLGEIPLDADVQIGNHWGEVH